MVVKVGNFKIFLNYKKFLSNGVLVESDDGMVKITVGMVKNFLDYALSLEAIKNPQLEKYKKAKKFFEVYLLLLNNKQPPNLSKDYFKAAADVIEEIENMKAVTDEQKAHNARMCLAVKVLIDGMC